jgi:hypothetical protein
VYLLFSANTMTGKSACSHPAQPAWADFGNVKRFSLQLASKIFLEIEYYCNFVCICVIYTQY